MNKLLFNTQIGETLRKLRINKKHSQNFVADCLNMSRTAYKEWENGQIDFTISKLERVALFYEIHLTDLIPPPQIVR